MTDHDRIRFLMVGGFLGAGKTTTLAQLAKSYTAQGLKVGLVTNDQADDLVDTETLRAGGFDVGEVAGACFCCNFDELISTMESLGKDGLPDIILAEPVGSCTDLVATVSEPIRRLYATDFNVGPYAVLLKPEHGAKILQGQGGGFSPQAAYIFLKQLEEAQLIVVNKIDKFTEEEVNSLVESIQSRFPGKHVLRFSARTGAGLDGLLEQLAAAATPQSDFMELDYDRYAEGEAELGWLNATYQLSCVTPVPLDTVVQQLVERVADAVSESGGEIAHLKVLGDGNGKSAMANQVSSAQACELSVVSGTSVELARLVVNARVAVDPADLQAAVQDAAASVARDMLCDLTQLTQQAFRPGRPVPTHSARG